MVLKNKIKNMPVCLHALAHTLTHSIEKAKYKKQIFLLGVLELHVTFLGMHTCVFSWFSVSLTHYPQSSNCLVVSEEGWSKPFCCLERIHAGGFLLHQFPQNTTKWQWWKLIWLGKCLAGGLEARNSREWMIDGFKFFS